jgi:hypothetical protein
MRRLFLLTISLSVLAGVGSAAATDWMGWSIGINGGGGTGTSTQRIQEYLAARSERVNDFETPFVMRLVSKRV